MHLHRAPRADLDEGGRIEDGPLFVRVLRSGRAEQGTRLSSVSARSILPKRLRDAGSNGRMSGHSLRVDSARSLVRRGANLPELQQAGRRANGFIPARYLRSDLAARGAVVRPRCGAW